MYLLRVIYHISKLILWSKISTVDKDQQIKEDCSRLVAKVITYEEFVKKYKLDYENEEINSAYAMSRKFCTYYVIPYRL